jgi:O-antigen/teichoic acid export membrane protein
MLLRAGGLGLVGTWAVLQLVDSYVGLCTAGLPSLIVRRVAATAVLRERDAELVSVALGGYLFVWAVLVASAAIFAKQFWHLVNLPQQDHVVSVVVVATFSGVVASVGVIYWAVLSGLQRTYVGQMAEAAGAISQFLVAVVILISGQSPLGLAMSLLVGKLTTLAIVVGATKQAGFFAIRPRLQLKGFIALFVEARGFCLRDIGYALLEPVIRAILAIMAGPSQLALFDMSNRIPGSIRSCFTNGLVALFPAVTALYAQKRSAEIEQALQASLGIVVSFVIAPLAAYMLLAKPVLNLWLGGVGLQVSTITLVTTTWWIASSYNIPFYFTALALGCESVVARTVWLHLVLISLGAGMFYWVTADAMAVSLLVLITGLVSQVQLYLEVQRRTKLLSITFASNRERIILATTVVLLACATLLRVDTTDILAEPVRVVGRLGIFCAVWLTILGLFTRGRPLKFLRSLGAGERP